MSNEVKDQLIEKAAEVLGSMVLSNVFFIVASRPKLNSETACWLYNTLIYESFFKIGYKKAARRLIKGVQLDKDDIRLLCYCVIKYCNENREDEKLREWFAAA